MRVFYKDDPEFRQLISSGEQVNPRNDLIISLAEASDPQNPEDDIIVISHCNQHLEPVVVIAEMGAFGVRVNDGILNQVELLPTEFPFDPRTGAIKIVGPGGVMGPIDTSAVEAEVAKHLRAMESITYAK